MMMRKILGDEAFNCEDHGSAEEEEDDGSAEATDVIAADAIKRQVCDLLLPFTSHDSRKRKRAARCSNSSSAGRENENNLELCKLEEDQSSGSWM